jgi:hypothetical protein
MEVQLAAEMVVVLRSSVLCHRALLSFIPSPCLLASAQVPITPSLPEHSTFDEQESTSNVSLQWCDDMPAFFDQSAVSFSLPPG